ncbi:hypothetical protein ADK82_30450 [Streptomyces sp. NRRL S-4]|nr:hypothetical protein ADK82_30450 [Streptomyces sp. NRRL S-4]
MGVRRKPEGATRDPRIWRVRKTGWYVPALVLTLLGAVVLVLLALLAVVTLAKSPHDGFWSLIHQAEKRCSNHSLSCGILQTILMPLLTLSLATVAYLFFRFSRVRRTYQRKARQTPHALVETAGSIFGTVVGRDQLSTVLMEDLRDCRTRRTHVVVGGVGTGKTALIVLLTATLARQKAVPVPLRLRNADKDLDFRQLAFARFSQEVQGNLRSDAEAEKVWRRLGKQGRIVVLADGLEEALTGEGLMEERDTIIGLAIRRANEQGLPLIITSRPHDSLRGMEVSLSDLEPLSEEAALAYISSGEDWEDRQRLDWIVEMAGITEAPTYLQIAAELHRAGLLERAMTGHSDEETVETRGGDRAALRFHLLDTYIGALVSGRFYPGLPLSQEERRATVDHLSALACVGLAADSAEVRFADLVDEQDPARPRYPELVRELARRVEGSRLDIRLAAYWGSRLGLVEIGGDRVRFQHSVVQAHLGARFMNAVIHPGIPSKPAEGVYFPAALRRPGRELLIAMVLYSRTPRGSCLHADHAGDEGIWCPVAAARDLLLNAASRAENTRGSRSRTPGAPRYDGHLLLGRSLHTKALDLYAAAMEIDSVEQEPKQHLIAMQLCTSWPDLRARDPLAMRAAKTQLVSRFGDAMRGVARRQTLRPAYLELFEIARLEPSYPVRLAIAQEIGAGGDTAFEELHPRLRVPRALQGDRLMEREPDWREQLWSDQQPEEIGEREGTQHHHAEGGVGRLQREHDEREQHRRDECNRERRERESAEQDWRDNVLCAWLLPLLVGSVTTQRHQDTPYAFLEGWVRRVGPQEQPDVPPLDLALEVALAQGFKYAANRRRRHPHARPEAREYLSEQAWYMLRRTRFWFSRLTLLHALTLWALTDDVRAVHPRRGPGSDPAEQVRQWLVLPAGEREHPFVVAAAKLSVRAMETQRPERFLWIDESGVAAHVGSQTAARGESRKHNLWVPPSTGWSALHPHAQQLLGDVLLLLNLAERGDWPKDRIRRLQHTDRPDLPPCLTRDRSPLDPSRTVVRMAASQAGSNCRDDCAFGLCPYPPKGVDGHRVELSEAFCRAQSALLSPSLSRYFRKAAWQRRTGITGLRAFWEEMGRRAQSDSRH